MFQCFGQFKYASVQQLAGRICEKPRAFFCVKMNIDDKLIMRMIIRYVIVICYSQSGGLVIEGQRKFNLLQTPFVVQESLKALMNAVCPPIEHWTARHRPVVSITGTLWNSEQVKVRYCLFVD